MNGEQIMKSDVIDILFENKNKAYGAYHLRKFYDRRLARALGIMLAMVVVFSAYTFLPEKAREDRTAIYDTTPAALAKAENKKEEKPQEKPKPKTQAASTAKLTSTVEIIKNNRPVDTLTEIDPTIAIGSVTTHVAPGTSGVLTVGGTPGGGGGGPEPVVVKIPEPELPVFNPEIPVENADVQPEFPGGMKKLYDFLQRNLNNPKDMEEGEGVSVKVKFVVGFDGKLKSFDIVQDGGEDFNREVLRVLKKMPAWIPGKSKGRDVSVYYTIPVKFTPAE
jgi:periplasmic protein TonB